MADYNKLLQIPRGTKARLETIKLNLLVNTIVYATDTKELGIKLSNGNIEYFKNATDIDAIVEGKVDKNASITAGTHTKITYDEKGLVTGGAGLAASDIPNLPPTKITQDASNRFVTDVEKAYWDEKVDKVSGMGLSSNDFTTTEKNKLSGIQAGAQVNAVTTVAGRTGAVALAKADVGLGSVQNYGISSQAQAIAGTVNTVYMTPLRTKEAITDAMGDIESALDAILGV